MPRAGAVWLGHSRGGIRTPGKCTTGKCTTSPERKHDRSWDAAQELKIAILQYRRYVRDLPRLHQGWEPFPASALHSPALLFQCWGEAPMGTHPVTRRASELERPQCMPHAGAVSFGRAPSPLVATGGEAVTATGKVSSLRVR